MSDVMPLRWNASAISGTAISLTRLNCFGCKLSQCWHNQVHAHTEEVTTIAGPRVLAG